MWTLYPDGSVRRAADGVTLVPDPSSDLPAQADYRAWLAADPANRPDPLVPAPTPPLATPYQIALALNDAGTAVAFDAALPKAKASDRIRWTSRTDPIPASNPPYRRICALAGIDPDATLAAAVRET